MPAYAPRASSATWASRSTATSSGRRSSISPARNLARGSAPKESRTDVGSGPVTGSRPPSSQPRLVSLDVLRGLTVAGMVLVNNPGTWSAIYAPLRHAAWHGWTPTDMVFPFFVFIVGVAIPIALGPRLEGSGQAGALGRVVRRSAIIFGVGLFLKNPPAVGG